MLFWVILMPSDCIPTFLVDFSLWRYEGVLFSHPREADLVEFLVLDNWFTWTSKMHGSDMLRRLDYISVNKDCLPVRPHSRVSVLP